PVDSERDRGQRVCEETLWQLAAAREEACDGIAGFRSGRWKNFALFTLSIPKSETYLYVREPAALAALVERIGAAEKVALDTEADSLHSYFEKLCLIQLSLEGKHYIVDPLAGLDLGGFARALAPKPLIFHGADYDLRMMRGAGVSRARRSVRHHDCGAIARHRADRAGRADREIFCRHARKNRAKIRLVAPAAERAPTQLRGR